MPSRRKTQSQRKRELLEQERERGHRDRVLTFRQWCAVNGFSDATGRRLIKAGDAPPILRLSERRVGIHESDNAKWQASRVVA
jgi:predicted DNA-binding transcriptional regulator AlpA